MPFRMTTSNILPKTAAPLNLYRKTNSVPPFSKKRVLEILEEDDVVKGDYSTEDTAEIREQYSEYGPIPLRLERDAYKMGIREIMEYEAAPFECRNETYPLKYLASNARNLNILTYVGANLRWRKNQ